MLTFFPSPTTLFNAIGIVGMGAILLAYFMQQMQRWESNQPRYLYANIIGATCLLLSLLWSWNLPSFLLECAWLMISMIGLVRYYRAKPNIPKPSERE